MSKLTDAELTITGAAGGIVHIFRMEPDAEDPEKCTFEYMAVAPPVDGVPEISPPLPASAARGAALEELKYGVDQVGDFLDEDLSVAVQQQKARRSRGYCDAVLAEQEARVRRFHEVLNDYLEGWR